MILKITLLIIAIVSFLCYFLILKFDFFSKSIYRKYTNSEKDKRYLNGCKISITSFTILYLIIAITLNIIFDRTDDYYFITGFDFYNIYFISYALTFIILIPFINIFLTPKIFDKYKIKNDEKGKIRMYYSLKDLYLIMTTIQYISIIFIVKAFIDIILAFCL